MTTLKLNNFDLEKIEANALDKKMYLPSLGKFTTQRELDAKKLKDSVNMSQSRLDDEIEKFIKKIMLNFQFGSFSKNFPKNTPLKFLDVEESQKNIWIDSESINPYISNIADLEILIK